MLKGFQLAVKIKTWCIKYVFNINFSFVFIPMQMRIADCIMIKKKDGENFGKELNLTTY